MPEFRSERFEERITLAVDSALQQLGVDVPAIIWRHLESAHNLGRSQVASRPDDFLLALKELFGGEATSRTEALIVRQIEEAFEFQGSSHTLAGAIEAARRISEKRERFGELR